VRNLADLGGDEVFVGDTLTGVLGSTALKATEFDDCTWWVWPGAG